MIGQNRNIWNISTLNDSVIVTGGNDILTSKDPPPNNIFNSIILIIFNTSHFRARFSAMNLHSPHIVQFYFILHVIFSQRAKSTCHCANKSVCVYARNVHYIYCHKFIYRGSYFVKSSVCHFIAIWNTICICIRYLIALPLHFYALCSAINLNLFVN